MLPACFGGDAPAAKVDRTAETAEQLEQETSSLARAQALRFVIHDAQSHREKEALYGTNEVEVACALADCYQALQSLERAYCKSLFEPRALAIWQWRQKWGSELVQRHIFPEQLDEGHLALDRRDSVIAYHLAKQKYRQDELFDVVSLKCPSIPRPCLPNHPESYVHPALTIDGHRSRRTSWRTSSTSRMPSPPSA